MRTSFWDIVGKQADLKKEMLFIEQMFCERVFYYSSIKFTLLSYINHFYFSDWAAKNGITCPSVWDLRYHVGIENFRKSGRLSIDEFLLYLECVENLVQLISKDNQCTTAISIAGNILLNIKTNCERLNFKVIEFSKGLFKIVEKNAAATAVADKYSRSDSEFSYKVIEYNHFLLKGNLGRKREILNAIADKFEAVKQKLKANGFSNIESDAGYLVNNINIRHNNTDPQSKSHKAHVAAMPPAELEEWYDKTYDVLLLALLASDFSELHGDIQELKKKIGAK